VHEEDHTYIKLYGYEGSPFLFPTFVCDFYFVVEVHRKYKTWSILFDKKRKRKFVSLPFNVANVTINISSISIEIYEILNVFNLKEA
jgi:hypothetical protein